MTRGWTELLSLLLLILILMLLAAAPIWPYSREWGYFPSTGIGIIFLAVVVLAALHVF
jgi:low affinity Fe/Cu permease